jgi:RNA-binding protein
MSETIKPLTIEQRKELRAQAHSLKPVAMIGSQGVTPALIAEVEVQLAAHGLIKIKAPTDDREERTQWAQQLCAALSAHPVQQIGKIIVIYRKPVPKNELPDGPGYKRWARNKVPGKVKAAHAKGTPKSGEKDALKQKKFYYGDNNSAGELSPRERFAQANAPGGRKGNRAKPVPKALSKGAQAKMAELGIEPAAPKPFGSVGRRRTVTPSGYRDTASAGTSPRSRSPISRLSAKSRTRSK